MIFSSTNKIANGFEDGREPALVPVRSHALLLLAMLTEIRAAATDEQARGFVRAVGGRMAAQRPVAHIEFGPTLLAEMNSFWAELGWGHFSFTLDDEGIDIVHRGMPTTLGAGDDGVWSEIVPILLEGIYDHWFQSLGGGTKLRTWIIRRDADQLELRHGL